MIGLERTDGNDKFSFDSDAEREWASISKVAVRYSVENVQNELMAGKNQMQVKLICLVK